MTHSTKQHIEEPDSDIDNISSYESVSSVKPSNSFFKNNFNQYIVILSFAFSIMLLLVIFVTWYGINNISTLQKQMESVVDGPMEKVIATSQMESAARLRIMNMYRMALVKDPFVRDELYMELESLANKFTTARLEFLNTEMSDEEIELLQEQGRLTGIALPLQRELSELLILEQDKKAHKLLINEVTPAQSNVSNTLTEIFKYQVNNAKQALVASRKNYEQTLTGMLWMSGSALLIGLSIMIFIIKLAYRTNTEREKYLSELEQINEAFLVSTRQLANATMAADTANETKSSFMANMSHEMRTPLTAIIGFAEDLLTNKHIDKESKPAVQIIARSGKHLLRIINEVLDISKIESGKLEIEKLDCSLFSLVHDVKILLNLQIEEKGLQLNVKYNFPLPEIINTDPTRLKQILLNLCFNAIKFCEKGSVDINISYEANSNKLIFAIKDTGIGMSEEQLGKVFKDFTQGDTSTTRKYGGTGLGLSISLSLSRMLGGDIQAESIEGIGSIFTLNIDPGVIDNSKLINKIPDHIVISDEMDKTAGAILLDGKILLAEDNKDNQALLLLLISKTGAELEMVENGEKAVEAALSGQYDLILMDMQMPVMDGLEATSLLRQTGFSGPIVALTANARKGDIQRCKEAGCTDFLSKPVDRQAFYATLEKYLNSSDVQSTLDVDDGFRHLVDKYVNSLHARLSDIKSSYEKNKLDTFKALIHDLKGMGGSFGFPQLTSCAKNIETHIKTQDHDSIRLYLNELETTIDLIVMGKITSHNI